MAILIVSTSYNDHAQKVGELLCASGEEVLRFNVDLVNLRTTPSIAIRTIAGQVRSLLDDAVVRSIRGVFVHHPVVETTCDGIDALDVALCRASWVNAIDWIEQSVCTDVWINRPSSIQPASSILRQAKVAAACGLRVPAMIFTNNLAELRVFAERYGNILIKPGNLPGIRMKGKRMLARLIKVDDIDERVLGSAPCLFQEYIEKQYEMRVHVVGSRVLTCKIDSQSSPKTRVDWRNYDIKNTPHNALEIDNATANKCQDVVETLGLRMGILDLIRTTEGEIVFLECNAQGHWIWIEELTGLPITRSVCDELRSTI